MQHIRLATEKEVEAIKTKSHFTPSTAVYAMDEKSGEPHIAVVRMTPVMDPVFFSKETNGFQRAKFVQLMEAVLFGAGIPQYFFNVEASDTAWQKAVESWGSERVSSVPEIQYERVLR